jgi:hypothetical protein
MVLLPQVNKRLQPLQMYATCQSAATCPNQPNGYVMNRSYSFNLGNGTIGSGTDNGNVISITNNLVTSRSQNFTYDSLNRITAGYSNGTNWGETYTIDAWGNLTNVGTYSGKNPLGNLNCAAASTKNQLTTCFRYDAAGNMTSNGSLTYSYDAENRIIAAGRGPEHTWRRQVRRGRVQRVWQAKRRKQQSYRYVAARGGSFTNSPMTTEGAT